MDKKNKLTYVAIELAHHLPYSIFGITLGIIIMGMMTFFAILMQSEHLLPSASRELFHIFHPAHVLFSAVATTAMFLKHEKRWLKAVIVGLVGSLSICGISDIFFPYVGGLILGAPMDVHVCIINEPGLVLPFAVVGIIAGVMIPQSIEKSTQYSHSAHVFLSSMASILYLVSFGVVDWIHALGGVFMVTIIAVMIPCCMSDIVFPLTCVHRECTHD